MKIEPLQQNVNFKQIKLSEAELKNAKNIYLKMVDEPMAKGNLFKMFDIFESHLNKEVVLKRQDPSKGRKIFAVTLFAKFFQYLEETKKRFEPFEAFIKKINCYSSKYNLKEDNDKKNLKYSDNVTTIKDNVEYVCDCLEISKENFLEITKGNFFLYYLTIPNFKFNFNNLKKYLSLEEDEFKKIIRNNVIVFSRPSEEVINDSNYLKTKLNLDEDTYKAMLKKAPILRLTKADIDKRIEDLTNLLGVDESRVLLMLPRQAELLTMQLYMITENFNSIQGFLNVDKNKMSEIAVMVPKTIGQNSDETILDWYEVVNTLKIPLDSFIESANKLPAIYRMSSRKLNSLVNCISKELGFSQAEAINYISKNLVVLSYNIPNIKTNLKNNYEILKEGLGIDYEEFIQMARENVRILGERKSTIKDNITNISSKYNLDKEALRYMVKQNPFMPTTPLNYVENCISDCANFLGYDDDKYEQICIKYPILITRGLDYLKSNISVSAYLRGLEEDVFVDMCKKDPELLVKKILPPIKN